MNERGFSLIEALVVSALVAVAILGVQAVMVTGVASGRVAMEMTSAAQLAAQQMERLRTADLALLAAGGALTLNDPGYFLLIDDDGDAMIDYIARWQITDLPVGERIEVRVFATRNAQGTGREVTLRSFVGWAP